MSIISPWCYLSVLLVIYLNVYTYLIIVQTCLAYNHVLTSVPFHHDFIFSCCRCTVSQTPCPQFCLFLGNRCVLPSKAPPPKQWHPSYPGVHWAHTEGSCHQERPAVCMGGTDNKNHYILSFIIIILMKWICCHILFLCQKIHVTKFTCMQLYKNWNIR